MGTEGGEGAGQGVNVQHGLVEFFECVVLGMASGREEETGVNDVVGARRGCSSLPRHAAQHRHGSSRGTTELHAAPARLELGAHKRESERATAEGSDNDDYFRLAELFLHGISYTEWDSWGGLVEINSWVYWKQVWEDLIAVRTLKDTCIQDSLNIENSIVNDMIKE